MDHPQNRRQHFFIGFCTLESPALAQLAFRLSMADADVAGLIHLWMMGA